jgi:hypothetical protein
MLRKTKNTERWKEDKLIKKGVCFECGSTEFIHYHHVIPEVKGGKKTLPLCDICHGKVHDKNFKNYRELQRIGIEKAKYEGKFKGRKPGSIEDLSKFLSKPKVVEINTLLNEGVGVRKICRITGSSPNYIYKVKSRLKESCVSG